MSRRGPGGKATFLMFDEETEQLAGELGLEVAFPSASLRHRLDSKIVTTQLGNEAGVPSVPNAMGRANDYAALMELARAGGLGDDVVVQTPYGDSGQTTFFIADEGDWKAHVTKIVGQDIKVMRRIDPRECAIEGVITRHGTLVGPLMAELTGFPELTPYDGGWCGNDVFPDVLTEGQRALAQGTDVRDGRASAPRGLSRVLRARLLGGRVFRRDVPGRAQPASDGRIEHHERYRGRVRRHALVPVPSARVHGRGVRDRCRRAQRPMGASRQHRRLDAVHPQADGRSCGADRRGSGVRRVEHGRRPFDLVRPARDRLAHRGGRARGVLPADRRRPAIIVTPEPIWASW